MATVVHNALYTDQVLAGDAVVLHLLLRVNLTEVALLQNFLMLHRVVQSDKVLGQLLGLERLVQGSSTDWTESHLLFFYLAQTFLTEGVTAVQVARDARDVIKVLVARRALHLICLFKLLNSKVEYIKG